MEYLVSWQQPDTDLPVPRELMRNDFKVKIIKSRGVAKIAMQPFVWLRPHLALMTDDDVRNTPEQLKKRSWNLFEKYPDMDLITFKIDIQDCAKSYPSRPFDLETP